MYCRNCGNEISKEAGVCSRCGAPAGKGKGYCRYCGKETHPDAVMYVTNDEAYKKPEPEYSDKSRILAGWLGIFFGQLGIHNFYLGYVGKGVAQILLSTVGIIFTCGLSLFVSSIWGFLEGIFILCDNINYDGYGKKFKKKNKKK